MSHAPQTRFKCQIPCLPYVWQGYAEVPPESLARRLRLLVRRSLNARQVRLIKSRSGPLIDSILRFLGRGDASGPAETEEGLVTLQAGDTVRVRSQAEIKGTLNAWGQLKNCMFMPEMAPYCGTVQRVFKPLERFVDERDYHVKKSRGIVLLEGLHCQGTSDYGRCDRACFYFWRVEWLEKVERDRSDN